MPRDDKPMRRSASMNIHAGKIPFSGLIISIKLWLLARIARTTDVIAAIIENLPQSSFLPYFAESFGVKRTRQTIGR